MFYIKIESTTVNINIKDKYPHQSMYQNQNPYQQGYQQGYPNNYDPHQNNNPYMQAGAFNRGSIPNQYSQGGKYNQGEYYEEGNQSLQAGSRNGFIRKVYSLVTIQLLITAGIGYLGYNNQGFRQTFGSMPAFIIITVLLITLCIIISCCTDIFRRYALPIFVLFTALLSLLVAIGISAYKSESILAAVLITSVLVVGLTVYACCTTSDFTGAGPYLFMFCLVLGCFGFALIFWKNPMAQLIYSCLGAFLFCVYIIYDTQLIIGSGKFKFSLDDAYLAAINLYLDIVNLFLHILRLFGR